MYLSREKAKERGKKEMEQNKFRGASSSTKKKKTNDPYRVGLTKRGW